ncbi:MAG: TetR/AcrR family transcriptional regulator [Myxococcales bacterium]|nr:TetR/AcrR family transcriptional regulator [Myxococcales bacterium]
MNTRERILRAAGECFAESGFDGASTRQIAERSGVNKALIHYHFKTKEELFFGVFDDYYRRLIGALVDSLELEGTFEQRFAALIDSYVAFLAANRDLGCVIQWEASGGKNIERVVAQMVPLFQRGIELIEERHPLTKEGDLAASQLLLSFYGMIVTYFVHTPLFERLLGIDPLSDDALQRRKTHLRRMLSITLQQLELRPPEPRAPSPSGTEEEPNR